MSIFGQFFLGRSSDPAQLRYLSKAAQIEETMNPRLARATVLTLGSMVLLLIAWSSVANINEIARASGEVVPSGSERDIQHVDGGTVEGLFVSEGDLVEAGQVLLRLDGADLRKDLARAEGRLWSLRVQETRLLAYVRGSEPDFSPLGAADHPRIASARETHEAMVASLDDRRMVARKQYEQKKHETEVMQTRLETTGQQLTVLLELLERRRELLEKGFLTRTRFLDTQQQVARLEGQIAVYHTEIAQSLEASAEFAGRIESIASDDRSAARQTLDGIEAQIAETIELVEKMRAKAERLEVRAPVTGTVKGLDVTNIGSVVRPATSMLKIVPQDELLVVRVEISPRDVGHLQIGLPVQLRVSAYDFGRYGSVTGTLEAISAATFEDGQGGRYFAGEIALLHPFVGDDPLNNPITPGMTVSADIVTGSKTVLEYLLRPVHSALSSALSER